jgi:hypothetical protein
MFYKIRSGKFINNGTGGDGVMGLAPHSNNPDLQVYNFMDQLKSNG